MNAITRFALSMSLLVSSFAFPASLNATVLTFDGAAIAPLLSVDQDYGDAVTNSSMPGGLNYGENGEGFTPNVAVDYGPLLPVDADARVLSTGFGDLTDALYCENEGLGRLQVTFTANPGYRVELHSWDMAGYSSVLAADPEIGLLRVLDSEGPALLSMDNVTISKTTHTAFAFPLGSFVDDVLTLEFDASNLGFFSQHIAFGNIVFSERAVPESSGIAIAAIALSAAAGCRRRIHR